MKLVKCERCGRVLPQLIDDEAQIETIVKHYCVHFDAKSERFWGLDCGVTDETLMDTKLPRVG